MVDTNESLLQRLRAGDAHDAWQQFYDLYWSAILRYAFRLGLDETQARDTLQETMVALMRVLPKFVYDPERGRFRHFLLTIVRHRALQVVRRARNARSVSWETSGLEEKLSAPAEGVSETESVAIWKESLMEDALARLRSDRRLAGATWPVFEAYVIDRQPAPEVARKFGLKENAVYQIRARLLRRLRTDVERRMRDSGSSTE